MTYFIALLVPTLIAFILMCFFHAKITLKEFFVQLAVQLVAVSGIVLITMNSSSSDMEVWNGQVTNKRYYSEIKTQVYPCRCKPKGGCSTCTRSWTEYNWVLDTNLNERICVRCGSLWPATPDLYNQIRIGDPVASPHSYENPIKAAPQSLFRNSGNKNNQNWKFPQYPLEVYDSIKIDRVLSVNGAFVRQDWQDKLAEMNKRVGPKKQTNVVYVFVKDYPSQYFYALREKWLGGKKNDIIAVIGVDGSNQINWVEVMAWSQNHMIEVTLRDDIKALGLIDFDKLLATTESHVVADYIRKPMKDFEYLFAQVTPTLRQWIFFMIFSVILSVGLSIFFYKEDVFNEEAFKYRKNRRLY